MQFCGWLQTFRWSVSPSFCQVDNHLRSSRRHNPEDHNRQFSRVHTFANCVLKFASNIKLSSREISGTSIFVFPDGLFPEICIMSSFEPPVHRNLQTRSILGCVSVCCVSTVKKNNVLLSSEYYKGIDELFFPFCWCTENMHSRFYSGNALYLQPAVLGSNFYQIACDYDLGVRGFPQS